MFCPKCGAQISDGSAFCKNCGAQLNNAQAPQQPVQQPYQQPVQQPAYAAAPVNRQPMNLNVPMLIKYGIIAGLQFLLFIFWFIPSVGLSYGGYSKDYSICEILGDREFDMGLGFITVFTVLFFLGSIGIFVLPIIKKNYSSKLVFFIQFVCPGWTFIWLIAAFAKCLDMASGYGVDVYFNFGGWLLFMLISGIIAVSIIFAVKGGARPAPAQAAPYQAPQQNQYNNNNRYY